MGVGVCGVWVWRRFSRDGWGDGDIHCRYDECTNGAPGAGLLARAISGASRLNVPDLHALRT